MTQMPARDPRDADRRARVRARQRQSVQGDFGQGRGRDRLNADELSALGGSDAGAVAKALHAKGTLSVWQYATRKAANGDLEQAPRAKIGLMAQDSLRIEPYKSPLKVLPHE